jgi:hypothetical protein
MGAGSSSGGEGGGGSGRSPPKAPKGLGAGLLPKKKPAVPRLPIPSQQPPADAAAAGDDEEVIEIDATAAARGARGGFATYDLDLIGDDLDDAFGAGDDDEGSWESASNASEEVRMLLAAIGQQGGGGGGKEEEGGAPWEQLFDRGTLVACGAVIGLCAATLAVLAIRAGVRGRA